MELLQMKAGHTVSGGLTGHLSLQLCLKCHRRIQSVSRVQMESLLEPHTMKGEPGTSRPFGFLLGVCDRTRSPYMKLSPWRTPCSPSVAIANTHIQRVYNRSWTQRESTGSRGDERDGALISLHWQTLIGICFWHTLFQVDCLTDDWRCSMDSQWMFSRLKSCVDKTGNPHQKHNISKRQVL